MSNPSLVARLGLTTEDFTRGLNASEAGLKSLQDTAKVTAAQIALLEREMAARGGGTTAQGEQHKQLQESLRITQKEAQAAAQQLRALEAIQGNGAGGHGHGGGNKAQLAHSGRATLEMIMAGQSPLQAAQIEAPRIIQAFGGGLGTMLGVGAGIAVLNTVRERISETIAKAQELKSALIEALRPGPSQGSEDAGSLRGRVKELDKVIEDAAPKLKFWDRLWERAGDQAHADGVQVTKLFQGKFGEAFGEQKAESAENADHREEAEHLREGTLGKIVALEREANDLRATALTNGQESVRQAELEIEKKQKLARIEEEMGLAHMQAEMDRVKADPTISDSLKQAQLAHLQKQMDGKRDAARQLQAEVEREYATKSQEAARTALVADVHAETERRILEIKREGLDVDKQSAKLRLEEAQLALQVGPKSGVQHKKNEAAVIAAQLAVDDTGRSTAEKDLQRQRAKKYAEMTGTQSEKERSHLTDQYTDLAAQIQKGSPTYERDSEKRKDIAVQLAQNLAAQRALGRGDTQRAFQVRENEISASTKLGPQGLLESVGKRLTLVGDRAKDNAAHENDPVVASDLAEKAHQLRMQKEAILFAEEQALVAAKGHTREMQFHAQGADRLATLVAIRAKYEQQIAQAIREGRADLAAQLRTQQALELIEQRRKAYFASPQERLDEQNKARKAKQDAAKFDRDDGLLSISRDVGGNAVDGYDPMLGRRRAFGDHSAYQQPVANADKNATPGVNVQVAVPVTVTPPKLPNRIDEIRAGHANAGKDDSHAFNDKNIVTELKNVVIAVKNISLKNRP